MSAPAVVLITGGARGIGYAVAERCVARGARVILWDVDAEALRSAARSLGPLAFAQRVDIADAHAVEAAEAALPHAPTHLVNNAGILGRAMAFDAMQAEEIDRALAINLRGTLLVTAAFLRAKAPCDGASILNMSSIAGMNGGAKGHAVYGATKGAMLALTAAMARDLAPELRVNALAPGIIDTEIQTQLFADRAALEATTAGIPQARLGTADEVAEAAEWLLFGAGYVSGETLRVAGGRK
ncbi:SDR family NAD(P)-dependent oxidoreductase [Phaeovulum sp. W22_SRMD_FR3]|uniref:SDR family NAD(P)-dependent oxidoreductase n=1 Tax=Phaeovulum sp. W22_SRMD_FR3 TaxID=3240274 RepID=UPI003F9AB764